MKLFQDSDGAITLQKDAQRVRISRSEFKNKFPTYQLPEQFAFRHWDGNTHTMTTASGDQSPASDIAPETFETYLNGIPYFKGLKPVPEPPESPTGNSKWTELENKLRGSSAWGKMYAAMEATTRCNAAGTLIIGSFSLQNENDLRAGWFALRDAMLSQATAPKFTENELLYVRDALEESGFDSETFNL